MPTAYLLGMTPPTAAHHSCPCPFRLVLVIELSLHVSSHLTFQLSLLVPCPWPL